MAKKKTHHRKHGHRRISGTKSGLMHALELIGGGVAGGVAARMAANTFGAGKDPKLVAGGLVLVGAFMTSKSKNALFQGVGLGIGTTGAVDLLHSMNVIKGIGEGEPQYISLNGGVGDQTLIDGIDDGVGAWDQMRQPTVAGDRDSVVAGI